jgi:UDP-N-acetylenolpyruvoylglucosamine reductase
MVSLLSYVVDRPFGSITTFYYIPGHAGGMAILDCGADGGSAATTTRGASSGNDAGSAGVGTRAALA